jgi:type IV pilus assembly protein PilN
MIKVNLLRDQTASTRIITRTTTASPVGLMMLGAIVLVAAAIGTTWYFLRHEIDGLTVVRNRLNVENTRLQGLRKEIDRYEQLRRERQSRVDIIEQLKTNQTGPVRLLNQVIRSIPTSAAVWLTALEQKGDQVRITGFTVRGETIPDFMSNLSATGYFKTVDLELYEDQDKGNKDNAAKFTLVCVSSQRKRAE